VRFRGLAKNTAHVITLFALSNLWMARKQFDGNDGSSPSENSMRGTRTGKNCLKWRAIAEFAALRRLTHRMRSRSCLVHTFPRGSVAVKHAGLTVWRALRMSRSSFIRVAALTSLHQ
jgi:hypothetical protein